MYGNKGGGKGKGKSGRNPALRDPAKIAKNQEVMDLLLPHVAGKVDESNGVMKIADIAAMSDVIEMMKEIPQGFSKQLNAILARYTDFFVNLPNGLVGTAKGYETGLIKKDGTLDPSYAAKMAPSAPVKRTMSTAIGAKVAGPKAPLGGTAKKTLTDAVNQMWTAGMNLDDDTAMYLAFSNLQSVRSELKKNRGQPAGAVTGAPIGSGTKKPVTVAKAGAVVAAPSVPAVGKGSGKGAPAVNAVRPVISTPAATNDIDGNFNLSAEERQMRKQAIMDRAVQKLQAKSDGTLLLTQIVADEVIKENRKGTISKFLTFFQEFPTVFAIEHVAGTPQHRITLIGTADTTVPLQPNKRARME